MTKEAEEITRVLIVNGAALIAAFFTGVALVIKSVRGLRSDVGTMSKNLDGKMSELLQAKKAEGKYEGYKEGLATPITTSPVGGKPSGE